MRNLLIYAHPNHESLCAGLYQSALKGLETSSQEVLTIDLYAEQFDPVLIYNAEKRRRDMYLDPSLEEYRTKILWADRLIFIYPIFWGRPPAMLLGFIDRIFASNFAYRDTGGLFPEQLLKGKSAVCISTMKGPAGYMHLWLGNAHQNLMKKALFSFVGIKGVKFFEFGDVEKKNGKQKTYVEKIARYFQK